MKQNDHSGVGSADQDLKEKAIEYYRVKAPVYNERYTVKAAGDLLWVRHRALISIVQGWGLAPGARLLDLGCGPGLLSVNLARLGYNGVGLDASSAMIELSRRRAQEEGIANSWSYELGDVEAVPLPDRSFDGAVCAGVIDYLPTDDKLLSEAARVLKPNGRLGLCVTNRFGYTVSLSATMYWIKRVPGMPALASWIRSVLVGGRQGAMDFDFLPRKHRPKAARAALARHGFHIDGDRYCHFSVLPAPLCTIVSKIAPHVDERLDVLDHTRLRHVGSCYIMSSYLDSRETADSRRDPEPTPGLTTAGQ